MKRTILSISIPLLLLAAFGSCVMINKESKAKTTKAKVKKAPAPKADATITNSPLLAGRRAINLPTLPAGATRTIVDGDGCFEIDANGDLIRGKTNLPNATTKKVTVREKKTGEASPKNTTYVIAIKPADWTLEAFPEMIVHSFTQESVGTGKVSSIDSKGIIALAKGKDQASAKPGKEPIKKAKGKGIEFPADGAKLLSFRKDNDAVAQYRWSLVIFRVNPNSGSGKIASILRVNDGPQGNGRSGNWFPRIDYDKSNNSIHVYYRGTKKHELKSPANSVATDGRWNVVLTYRRYGRLFLRVNGKACDKSPANVTFSTEQPDDMIDSRIGDRKAKSPAWALDGVWIGQSELSEPVVKKIEAWALQRPAGLPGGAAAKAAFKPVVDEEDFPHRYFFVPERYAAWKKANPKEKRLAYQGKPAAKVQPNRSNWVCVFADDFRKPAQTSKQSMGGSSVGDSTYDLDAGKQIWYAPGTNCAVGGRAICKDGNDRPYKDVYVLDPESKQLTMKLYCSRPAKNGKPSFWKNSQFSSINQAGLGYSWAGRKGFRVRAKFNNVGDGVFPAPLWFYSLEHMFWRTGERIEFDIIELDDNWDNYGATHVHHGRFKGLFGHSKYDTMKKKSVPPELKSLKLAAGKQVLGVNAFDGKFHTWEVWIHNDKTYINVDGKEVVRVNTIPEYLERLFMYVDTCLKGRKGMNEKVSYDMVLDKVEAFQPASDIDATPAKPFRGRPTLSGTATPGSTITCNSNITGVKDVWYYWHSDGYPRGFSISNKYKVLPEDQGAEIRCKVVAVGARNQPEAWTAPLRIK